MAKRRIVEQTMLARLAAAIALVAAVLLMVGGSGALAVSEAAATGSIAGVVYGPDGSPHGAVAADLYTEGRETYLQSTASGADGSYRFDVEPGCYVMTLIAPDGYVFLNAPFTNTTPYRGYPVCVADGEAVDIGRDNLIPSVPDPGLFIEVQVRDRGGAPVGAVAVDLFASTDGEDRGQYLQSLQTDADGNGAFSPALPLGCYVVTYIAPGGGTFIESGSSWRNQGTCAIGGPGVWSSVATLDQDGPPQDATAGGLVTDGAQPVAGLVVDLFAATADGSRGTFLGDTKTAGDGQYQLIVSPGCYVLTLIAPSGRTFIDTETGWSNRSFCVDGGQSIGNIDAALR